ncbi:MAG: hypothetical protein ACLQDV_12550 [Candidatus Binataceae bacterium]
MKRYVVVLNSIILACAVSASAQSIPLHVSSPTASPSPAAEGSQTITGRITHLDTKGGAFSVKSGSTKKTIQLKAGDGVDVLQLRRGERVVVTYANGVALTVQATRNLK